MKSRNLCVALAGGVCIVAMATPAQAQTREYRIPAGSLKSALDAYARQSGRQIIYKADEIRSRRSTGVSGNLSADAALTALLNGSGFSFRTDSSGAIAIVAGETSAGGAAAESESAEIVVTGSHIRAANPTSPVHVITRRDIEESGYSQVGDLMRSLPQNFSGGQNPGVLAGAAGGNIANQNYSNSSTVNLRGLGTDATLVLVNGHRLAADSVYQGSDISAIPLAALSRVEVVTDGVSAIYGSDAVAGVVNFITRKDYDGGRFGVRFGTTTQGGGTERTISFLQGVKKDNWHILLNAEYSRQDAVTAGQRNFTASAPPAVTLWQPQERKSIFTNAGFQISSNLEISVDILASERDSQSVGQFSGDSTQYLTDTYTPAYMIAPTVEYKLGNSWRLRLTGNASGGSNKGNYQTVTDSGTSTYKTYLRNLVQTIEAAADGALFKGLGGDVKGALGIGYRRSSFRRGFSDQQSYISESENVKYVFGEINAPIVAPSDSRSGLNELDVSISGRVENYSSFGSAKTPKVGVRYRPFHDLTVRGTWGKSFKAPSFIQRYQTYDVFFIDASLLGFSGLGQAIYLSGGNRDLEPERSTSHTISAEYSPSWTSNLTLSATYFHIEYRDRVVNPIAIPTNSFSDQAYSQFIYFSPSNNYQAQLIENSLTKFNFLSEPYDPSKVVAVVDNRYNNATSQTVQGVDFSARKEFELAQGRLSVFANGTLTRLHQRVVQEAASVKLSGTVYNVPTFRARSGITWQSDGLSLTAIVNHVSPETDTGTTPVSRVGSWTIADAMLTYAFMSKSDVLSGLRIDLAISNIFDKAPPRVQASFLTSPGLEFDSTNHSLLGRQVSLTLSKSW